MKKKHIFMAITFFIVGLVYGAIFNFILRGENASVISSFIQGLFVGMLASIFYFIMFVFFRYCYENKYFNDTFGKCLINFCNIFTFVDVWYGITMFINSFNKAPITLNYAWMHLVNMLFVVAVVVNANYDGRVLKKRREK